MQYIIETDMIYAYHEGWRHIYNISEADYHMNVDWKTCEKCLHQCYHLKKFFFLGREGRIFTGEPS